jgi:NADP-dependent alcohol dehydrogenase
MKLQTRAIAKTVEFSIPWEWILNYLITHYDKTADFIVNRFDERGWKGLGEKQNITLDKVKSIVEMSY